MNIHFENPDLLFLLWVVLLQAALLWIYWRWRSRTLKRLGSPALAQRLLLGFSAPRFWLKNLLFGLALVLLVIAIAKFGAFEIAPKKANVSLRRKKQFALLGPATNSRFEIGLNMKGVPGTDRLLEQPPGGMCQYKVKLTDAAEVDAELIGWIRQAYDAAG